MGLLFRHPVSETLAPDDWQDKINLDALSHEDLMILLYDMRRMENFGKKVGNYLKEVIKARVDMGEHDEWDRAWAELADSSRKNGLDEERMAEDMGEEFVEKYRKPDSEFVTIKVKMKEE